MMFSRMTNPGLSPGPDLDYARVEITVTHKDGSVRTLDYNPKGEDSICRVIANIFELWDETKAGYDTPLIG